MIIEKNFVSLSDLRDHTGTILKDIHISGKKIILSKNKPICVCLSIEEYNNIRKLNFEREKATPSDIISYKKSSHGKEWVEAFNFLETLQ